MNTTARVPVGDYIATVRIQNGRIRRLMAERGLKTASDLARVAELTPTEVGCILNFKKLPIKDDGEWRESVSKIADVLGVLPEEMFSAEHLTLRVPTNRRDYMLNHDDIMRIAGETFSDPSLEGEETMQQDQLREFIASTLDELPPRERKVIAMRFGLNGCKESTLDEIAAGSDVTRERIRQIEAKALGRLRKKIVSVPLAIAAGIVHDEVLLHAENEHVPLEPQPDKPSRQYLRHRSMILELEEKGRLEQEQHSERMAILRST